MSQAQPGPPADANSVATLLWLGARPRTLPAAVVPVAVGVAAGVGRFGWDAITWWRAGVALVVSLALQIGVNYANDYSDGVRGTDTERVGPMRLVGSGAMTASGVRRAAFGAFGIAAVGGLALAAATTWWLLAVGVAAIAAAWGYTGGPRPYGYLGLGEVFVFVFFGLVATVGTTYVAFEKIPAVAWIAAVGVGSAACALLVINNLRDIPTDRVSGKRTVAVRIGDRPTRWLYCAFLVAAIASGLVAMVWQPATVVVLLAAVLAVAPIRAVLKGASGRDLIAVLGQTGRFQLAYGLALSFGLAWQL